MATFESSFARRDQNHFSDSTNTTDSSNHTPPATHSPPVSALASTTAPSSTPSSASASASASTLTSTSSSMSIRDTDTCTLPTALSQTPSSSNESTPRDRRRSFTYESTSPNGSSEASPASPTPLSMSFMHKPSRSENFFTQSNDRTRENSIFNKTLSSFPSQRPPPQQQQPQPPNTNSISSTSSSSSGTSSMDKSPTASPLLPASPPLEDKNDHFAPPDYFNHKSSLKSISRSKSLPTTPTFKVHFGNSDVRYFKKKDTPKTISASNSPKFGAQEYSSDDEDYDDDDDDDDDDDYNTFGKGFSYGYTYRDDDDVDDDVKRISSRGGGAHSRHNSDFHNFSLGDTKYPKPPSASSSSEIKWDLQLLNFAPLSYLKRIEAETPVFLERLFISADKKYLFGHIAVKNLAFEKYLTVRYSVDNWMTIIEIPTTYTAEKADVLEKNNYDRFVFKIPLENLFNTFKMSKTASTDSLSEDSSSGSNNGDVFRGSSLGDYQKERRYQFCIKYCTQGHEYWDNNRFQNYLVKLVKSRIFHRQQPQQAPQQKHHFYNLENKDSKLQDHAKKPRYSSSYLKRVGSDSGISYNNPGVYESRNNDEGADLQDDQDDDDDTTITVDANSSSSTLKENIEELLKNTGDAQIKSQGINNNRGSSSIPASTESTAMSTGSTNDSNNNNVSNKGGNNNGVPKAKNLQLDLDLDALDTVTTTTPKYKSKFITNQFNLNSNSNAQTKGNLSTGRSNAFNSDLKSKSYKEILDSYCFFKSDSANASASASASGGSGSGSGSASGSSSNANSENGNVSVNGDGIDNDIGSGSNGSEV